MADAGVTIDKWNPVPVASRLLAIDDSAGPNNGTITPGELADQMLAEGPLKDKIDQIEASQVTGDNKKEPVRVLLTVATAAAALTAGSTHDGVVLAAGDSVGEAIAGGSPLAGIWQVQASGAALRRADADTGAELVRATFTVDAGTHVGTTWYVETADITPGTTPIVIKKVANAPAVTGEVVAARGDQASLTARLVQIEGGQAGKLDAAIYNNRFGAVADIAGIKKVFEVVNPDGVRLTLSYLDQDLKQNFFKDTRYGGAGDVAGVRIVKEVLNPDGVRLAVSYVDDTYKPFWPRGVDSNSGSVDPEPEPETDYGVPAGYISPQPNPPGVAEGSNRSWWVFPFVTMGVTNLRKWLSGIGRKGDVPGRDDAPLYIHQKLFGRSIMTTTVIGYDSQGDDHNAPSILADPRWSNKDGYPEHEHAKYPLMFFQRRHGGPTPGIYFWVCESLDASRAGPKRLIANDVGLQTYPQPFRMPNNPDHIVVFFRASDSEVPRRWAFVESLDNGKTWGATKYIFSSDRNLYENPRVRRDGTGLTFMFHNHPGDGLEANDFRIMSVHLDNDGRLWSVAGGTLIANIFATSIAAVDPFVSGDVIVNPGEGNRLRMTDFQFISATKARVPYAQWAGDPASTNWANGRIMVAEIDYGAGWAVAPTVNIIDGGIECGKPFAAAWYGNAYICGACITSTGLSVAQWQPTDFPTQGVFRHFELGTGVPVETVALRRTSAKPFNRPFVEMVAEMSGSLVITRPGTEVAVVNVSPYGSFTTYVDPVDTLIQTAA